METCLYRQNISSIHRSKKFGNFADLYFLYQNQIYLAKKIHLKILLDQFIQQSDYNKITPSIIQLKSFLVRVILTFGSLFQNTTTMLQNSYYYLISQSPRYYIIYLQIISYYVNRVNQSKLTLDKIRMHLQTHFYQIFINMLCSTQVFQLNLIWFQIELGIIFGIIVLILQKTNMRNINNEIGEYQQKKLFINASLTFNQKKISQYSSKTKNLQIDPQFKQLIQQYEIQITIGKDKQKKIERITQQNIKVAQQNKKILAQISQLQEEIQKNKNQSMEQQKNQEQEQSQMKEFMYAFKLQSHGLQSLGLNTQEINLIPTFSYQKGFESDICLSCFQQLQNNTNIKCLPCCHIFHDNCIGQFLKQSRYCPACSQEVIVIS